MNYDYFRIQVMKAVDFVHPNFKNCVLASHKDSDRITKGTAQIVTALELKKEIARLIKYHATDAGVPVSQLAPSNFCIHVGRDTPRDRRIGGRFIIYIADNTYSLYVVPIKEDTMDATMIRRFGRDKKWLANYCATKIKDIYVGNLENPNKSMRFTHRRYSTMPYCVYPFKVYDDCWYAFSVEGDCERYVKGDDLLEILSAYTGVYVFCESGEWGNGYYDKNATLNIDFDSTQGNKQVIESLSVSPNDMFGFNRNLEGTRTVTINRYSKEEMRAILQAYPELRYDDDRMLSRWT